MNEQFRTVALATLATFATACVAEQPQLQSSRGPDAGDFSPQNDAATSTDEDSVDVITDERMPRDAATDPSRDAGKPDGGTDAHDPPDDAGGDGDGDDGIDTVAYECPSADEDAGADDGAEWPCAEPNGALESCVADAFSCAPSSYGSVAVASNGTEIALVSVTRDGDAVFARFDQELRSLGMVSFPLETGGFVVNWPRLAAHPGGWIFTYEAADFRVLGLSSSGSRVHEIGRLDNALPIQLAERPNGTPLLLVMGTVSIDEARASAVAIADDLSGFSKITDLGEVSVRDGAFVGDGYLAVMESQGASSSTSLQRLALDGTPLGRAVAQGTDLYRFGLVASGEHTHFFYTAYTPEVQQGYVVEVADDGTHIGEPQPLDPALNPEQGESALAWDSEHVMLQRGTLEARLSHIDGAQHVTSLATLTAPTDGIPIGLIRVGDLAVSVIVSQGSPYDTVTLAAVAPGSD
jgi:hypothetical protein